MLDGETRRRIDTARDILVGKVPDPKSQVEQITIALIYKFMDDMDAESEELGGTRKFFAGEFAKYGWARLMQPGLGGHETLNVFAEAISKMPENPGVPALFRDIFKNAYLPYRDPETLRAFLKVINEFEYDHSERLGDAFEYLLSVLGSQGDAGQFRTPRHIIDFIVGVIDPKKHETVLDPACGTAGFLISTYKHTLKANTDADGNSILTPDEKARLAGGFRGYDISPDMVRLSLVNMYLHGFADPHIFEYDTLTSQDRWNEYADVILANPPFMSPKGGIKPHNRFSVQSSRSEVLFVDYIAEHLTPSGRAGIIVPEGIIFQSQLAYKQLRKVLVEDYLVAVVSLPAGVFNPYSGVKTSVLILDKSLAKQTPSIAFFRIESDGFSLGAQRHPINRSDLPQAHAEITEYLRRLRARESVEDLQSALSRVVAKERIAANGEYNLSAERYRENTARPTRWQAVPLSELCEFRSGLWKGEKEPLRVVRILRNTNFTKDGFLDLTDVAEHPVEVRQLESRLLREGDILLEKSGGGPTQPVGRVALFSIRGGEYSFSNFTARIRVLDERADPLFVWLWLNHLYQTGVTEQLQTQTSGIRNLDSSAYQQLSVPLPPLEVQKEIVAEIEGYQRVIDGARAVLDNYRPHLAIRPDWPMVPVGELVASVLVGLVKNRAEQDSKYSIPYIKMNNITSGGVLDLTGLAYVDATRDELSRYCLNDGDFIYNTRNTPDLVGKSAVFHGESGTHLFNNNILRIRFGPRVLPDFVNAVMISDYGKAKIRAQVDGTTSVAALYQKNFLAIEVPLPPLATQQGIVADIEAERALVKANRELIDRLNEKIRVALTRVWDDGDSGPARV